MSRHGIPSSHRCAWCRQSFETMQQRATHERLIHRANFQRSQEAEAAARLQRYHADRMAVQRGRVPAP